MGLIPSKNPDYVWRVDLLQDLTALWHDRERCVMVSGPTGSGKTSLIEQWHAYLGWPLLTLTGHKRMMPEDFMASYLPNANGGLELKLGTLRVAAQYGYSVIINEINATEPDVLIAMNDLIESGSTRFVCPLSGEVQIIHPNFRVYGTKNPEGSVYAGRKPMDVSTRHRFAQLEVNFPSPEDEEEILVKAFVSRAVNPQDAKAFASNMVKVANSVRAKSTEVSRAPDAIPEVMSTRILLSWAKKFVTLRRVPNALYRSLGLALTNGSDRASRLLIEKIVADHFGVSNSDSNGVPLPV